MTAYHNTSAALARSKAARARVVLPTACGRCGGIIDVGMAFDMGHTHDVAHGGQDSELRPEHRYCNRRAGGKTAAPIRARSQGKKRARPTNPGW